jgi:hypothetical protein
MGARLARPGALAGASGALSRAAGRAEHAHLAAVPPPAADVRRHVPGKVVPAAPRARGGARQSAPRRAFFPRTKVARALYFKFSDR